MSKRISLITIHVGNNFGSVLQTIASYITLKRFADDVTVINYWPDRVTYRRYWKDALKSPIKFLWRLFFFPISITNKNIYMSYLKNHCKLSNRITSSNNFSEVCPPSDIYVTGSDQVWNSIHNEGFDGHYYFEGFPKNSLKIAFSSSIGRDDFDEQEKAKVRELLKEYKAISVREDSAVKILEQLGIIATQLIDPTFMLDRFQWKSFMSKRLIQSPYLLIYTPYNTIDKQLIYNAARLLADKFHLKVVTFSWNMKREALADKTIKFANPGDFLSLMNYADYIITNSFHGTAFSINLNKQFWVFQPSAFSTRIDSILRKTNLTSRMLLSEMSEKDITKIDYTEANRILDKERESVLDFLKKAIS